MHCESQTELAQHSHLQCMLVLFMFLIVCLPILFLLNAIDAISPDSCSSTVPVYYYSKKFSTHFCEGNYFYFWGRRLTSAVRFEMDKAFLN